MDAIFIIYKSMNNKPQDINDLESGMSIDDLLNEDAGVNIDGMADEDGDILEPLITIDITEVNDRAIDMATNITERLSNYYFDERYIKEHPYIPTKIMTEMENIRRLYKMLIVNENAQDALIKAITINAGKGTLYLSLTSLQKSILLIQKQLNDLVIGLEQIFAKMQADTEATWADKEKDATEDGSLVVRGSREFIKQMNARLNNYQHYQRGSKPIEPKLEPTEDPNLADCTPISEIVG